MQIYLIIMYIMKTFLHFDIPTKRSGLLFSPKRRVGSHRVPRPLRRLRVVCWSSWRHKKLPPRKNPFIGCCSSCLGMKQCRKLSKIWTKNVPLSWLGHSRVFLNPINIFQNEEDPKSLASKQFIPPYSLFISLCFHWSTVAVERVECVWTTQSRTRKLTPETLF